MGGNIKTDIRVKRIAKKDRGLTWMEKETAETNPELKGNNNCWLNVLSQFRWIKWQKSWRTRKKKKKSRKLDRTTKVEKRSRNCKRGGLCSSSLAPWSAKKGGKGGQAGEGLKLYSTVSAIGKGKRQGGGWLRRTLGEKTH